MLPTAAPRSARSICALTQRSGCGASRPAAVGRMRRTPERHLFAILAYIAPTCAPQTIVQNRRAAQARWGGRPSYPGAAALRIISQTGSRLRVICR